MLARMSLENLTVFSAVQFQFAAGLNFIVGENGSGKSHVLKAAYSVASVLSRGARDSGSPTPTNAYLGPAIAAKLRGVFRPEGIGRLARRQRGVNRCKIELDFQPRTHNIAFSFHTKSDAEVALKTTPSRWLAQPSVFLPTRELLTIYPGFVSLYETSELPFEETWRDTCVLLGTPLAKGRRLGEISELLQPLEEALDGKVVLENGRFYVRSNAGKLEAHLVAEGFRKLAMIAQLLATGSLTKAGRLFWDEPEANLNPKIIKRVARTILHLCKSGIQVFAASHSLFLLREFDILLKTPEFSNVPVRFFGLHPNEAGVAVEQGDTVDDIGTIDALDEELNQSDRYLAAEAD